MTTGVQAARGVHGSTYNKALASLKTFTPDQVAEMEEAAAYLKQPQGVLLCYQGSPDFVVGRRGWLHHAELSNQKESHIWVVAL